MLSEDQKKYWLQNAMSGNKKLTSNVINHLQNRRLNADIIRQFAGICLALLTSNRKRRSHLLKEKRLNVRT